MQPLREKIIFASVLCFMALGCTSALKRAEKLMEAGNYEDAVLVYEEILREQPQDPEALIGLKRAKDQAISQSLIRVRMARLGGDQKNAADLLLQTFQLEAKWGLSPAGPAAFSQEEEVGYSVKYLARSVEQSAQQGFPLQAHSDWMKFQPIFQTGGQKLVTQVKAHLDSSGKQKCQSLIALQTQGKPYFKSFVKKFCGFWGVSSPGFQGEIEKTDQDQKLSELYRDLEVEMVVSQLPSSSQVMLQNDLRESLKSSAWFHPSGKNFLKLGVKGAYSLVSDRSSVQKVHSYTVSVPYTVMTVVSRPRRVPRTVLERVCTPSRPPALPNCQIQQVIKYDEVPNFESVPETRYRSEVKTFPYVALSLSQVIRLSLQGEFQAQSLSQTFSVSDEISESGFEHSENHPEMKLMPQRVSFISPEVWMGKQSKRAAQEFSQKLSLSWNEMNCQAQKAEGGLAEAGEWVHRCLRNTAQQPPAFVQKWYEMHLGISVEKALQILGPIGF